MDDVVAVVVGDDDAGYYDNDDSADISYLVIFLMTIRLITAFRLNHTV